MIPISSIQTDSFNQGWIQSLIISGSPSGKTRAQAVIKPYDGTHTLDVSKTLVIDDVFGLAATDPQFAEVVTALITEVTRQAKLKNVI